ncbi:hypothetical protein FCM35_KLT20620 [Carex littledalei]|uniref:Calcium ion binding protein n=1 Tax=Carex littledalei TaxID=544730 RepID=A0A833RIU2_9POAL|nr:hypothetical protein FCM35_KLT20620 [Carex littledalei]
MGLSLSLLSKLGVPGVSSVTTDQFYERFFKDIQKFDQFHTAFIDLCRFINDVMPGKHFDAPTKDEIKKFYEKNWMSNSEPEIRKEKLTAFVKEMVKERKTDNDKTVIITGMVVPAAAVVLKNTAENLQPVKRFKLHLVPNFVFVPTCTFLALAGVQLMQVRKKSKS